MAEARAKEADGEVMNGKRANLEVLAQLDIRNVANCAHLFSSDFVWHYFNPMRPELDGNYVGVAGLMRFFEKLNISKGAFKSEPQSATAYGEELVVTHVRNTLTLKDQTLELDAVVVWRIVEGRILEAWDIPAVYTTS